jgi:NADH-quinone oxidoreductase subunit G
MAAGQVPRTARPFSGRTADDRAGRDLAATPPRDPDSPLSYGIEGSRGEGIPPALITSYVSHGLHSANAVTRFQQEIDGPLRGGDPGVLLIAPGQGPEPSASPAAEIGGQGLLLLTLHDAFSGSETSRLSALLIARAPAPRLLLHPDDAATLRLREGDAVLIDGRPCVAPVSLDATLLRGMVGISVGSAAPRGPLRRVMVEAAS